MSFAVLQQNHTECEHRSASVDRVECKSGSLRRPWKKAFGSTLGRTHFLTGHIYKGQVLLLQIASFCIKSIRSKPVTVLVSVLSRVRLFATLWTAACQVPLSMGFSRQEHWSGLPFHFPGHLPDPGIKLSLLHCVSCFVGRFFTAEPWGKPQNWLIPDEWRRKSEYCL